MKNVLKYFYNLDIDTIKEYNNYAIIESNKNIFIFKIFLNQLDDTLRIVDLIRNKVNIHNIVINNKNEILTEYDNKKYILLRINEFDKNVDKDLFEFVIDDVDNNTPDLWEKAIDYYSNQIKLLSLGKNLLIDSFNYYIGMAENALAIYNRSLKMNDSLLYSVSHHRVNYPNYAINYYDPTNMLIDVRVRDFSEYIKSKFFKSEIDVNEIIMYIDKHQYSNKEINILFSRLLYPSYYFDIFSNSIIDNYDEKDIIELLKKRRKYEQLLSSLYVKLKHKYNIYEIEWLK